MNRRIVIIGGIAFATLLGGCESRATSFHPPTRTVVKRMVAHEARDIGVPVALALAVAHAESNFNAYAVSRAGARGVMQVLPSTARSEYGIDPDRLWQPRVNIRLGLHFLARLIVRYHGRVDIALSHYNGGSAVGRPGRARVIPATRRYVSRVMRLETHYRREVLRGLV